jgi:hypothetical protein
MPKYPTQQSNEIKVDSCSRPSAIESPSYCEDVKAFIRGASDDVFDFSEIILKEQNNRELSGFGDGTIDYILEGTGGSGTSEMTHNLNLEKKELPNFYKKNDKISSIDGSSMQRFNSEDMPSKIHHDEE